VPTVRGGVYDSDFDSESVDTGSRSRDSLNRSRDSLNRSKDSLNQSKESLNRSPSHLALEYSLPIISGGAAEKPTKSPPPYPLVVGVSQQGRVKNHQPGHMLGVVESGDNNHHYHLLDVRADESFCLH